MKIELKNLKTAQHLSQETTAYSATIYVDGQRAFHASNSGHGGADHIVPLPGYTGPSLADIDAWLIANTPPGGPLDPDPASRAPYDQGLPCDLETLISRLITEREADKTLTRLCRKHIVTIGPDGKLYEFKAPPSAPNLALIQKRRSDDTIVNGGDESTLAKARRALTGEEDYAEAVHARQREGRLTLSDAQWLQECDKRAGRPCPDLQAELSRIIAAEEQRLAEYRHQVREQRERRGQANG